MNWLTRKIHLYNVTMGLYMLDWWERFLFNFLILLLLWFVSRSASDLFNRHFKPKLPAWWELYR